MPVIQPSPGQIDAARRILSHPAKRVYGKGSTGTTVRALKIFLHSKGIDAGPINGRWDSQMQRAVTKYGIDRATPGAIKKISADFGPPGPRPSRRAPPPSGAQLASMQPIMPGLANNPDISLRDALSGMPPASGVGPQLGMPDTETAAAMARRADRSLGDLRPPPPDETESGPEEVPEGGGAPPLDRGIGFGPGNGAIDPLQQGYGSQDAMPPPSNSDYIPPMPPGGGGDTGPATGDLGASADMSAQMTPEGAAAMAPDPNAPPDAGGAPPVMPSPAEGGMPFGPGNAAQDPLQQQLTPPPNWPPDPGASPDPGAVPPPDPNAPPDQMGAPPPPVPSPTDGLKPEDLVPPMAQSPAETTQGAMGSTGDVGNLGDLPPNMRAPDQASGMPGDLSGYATPPPTPGTPGDLSGYATPPDTGGMPGNLSGYANPPPDDGDLTSALAGPGPVPMPRQRPPGQIITIRKGDTLWKLAHDHLGDPQLWPAIAAANPGIRDPNKIYYGRRIVIPDSVAPAA